MIIGGALALVIALIAVIGIAAAASLAAGALGGGIIALAVIASILSLLGGGIELAAGILGVKNWNQPAKAQSCIVFGAIIIALSVLSNILNWLPVPKFNLFTLLLGLVLPRALSHRRRPAQKHGLTYFSFRRKKSRQKKVANGRGQLFSLFPLPCEAACFLFFQKAKRRQRKSTTAMGNCLFPSPASSGAGFFLP